MRLLLVGSMTSYMSEPDVSGTVISFKHLIDSLRDRKEIAVSVVDTGDIRTASLVKTVINYLKCAANLFRAIPKSDVVTIHLSPGGFAFIGTLIILLAKLFRRPTLFRLFGGMDLSSLAWLPRKIAFFNLGLVDIYLAQTHELINSRTSKYAKKVEWFPTSRPLQYFDENPYDINATSYIYLGHIKVEKGIKELISAFGELGPAYQLDVYGPFYDNLDASIFDDHENVAYRGVAPPDKVIEILKRYKALVFPSYLPGEGYSGAVIEAFSCGLPVLASNWKALPEMVDDECGGLFEPRSVDALKEAIGRFDKDLASRQSKSNSAYKRSSQYSSISARDKFLTYCSELMLK